MDKNNLKKEYTNGDITIVWQSGLCQHSGRCVKNNPDVFHPREQPWITPEKSSTAEIIRAIDQCPSGALSYYRNQPQEEAYDTLSEAIAALQAQGYTEDFNISTDCLECREGSLRLMPDDFHIDRFFRFEGQTDPADESILYAISSEKHGLKGLLVNGYGISSEPLTDEMLSKLATR